MGVIFGGMGGGFGGGRRGGFGGRRAFEGGLANNPFRGLLGLKGIRIMAFGVGMGMGGGMKKTEEIDENYNFPVIALKALSDYQPRN